MHLASSPIVVRFQSAARILPKRARLRLAIINAVEAGELCVGTKVVGERELSAALGLSLGTTQKALDKLMDEGFLVRRQGRGTFVGSVRQPIVGSCHFRFVAPGGGAELPVFATAVQRRLETAEDPWSLALGFYPEGYVMVRRSPDVGGKFTCTTVDESVKCIAADCDGMLTCATCHVLMDEPCMQAGSALPPPTSEESEMLQFTATERQPQSRLSCQIVLTPTLDGLTVRLPVSQH